MAVLGVFEPVELVIERECHFKARPLVCRNRKCGVERPRSHERAVPRSRPKRWPACPACGSTERPVQRQGCATCGMAKHHPTHWTVPTYNADGSGDPQIFQATKERAEAILGDALEASALPRPCGRIVVEGELTFPDRIRRDQGNFRVIPEKALGDVLKARGYLTDDDWDRFEVGGWQKRYEPGVSRLRLTLFPSPPTAEDLEPEQTSLLG